MSAAQRLDIAHNCVKAAVNTSKHKKKEWRFSALNGLKSFSESLILSMVIDCFRNIPEMFLQVVKSLLIRSVLLQIPSVQPVRFLTSLVPGEDGAVSEQMVFGVRAEYGQCHQK